ncbi:hypothetical protein [Dactylosporangium matsuzakiense]|uniref:Ricin-type beta-trefoil lectin protein n=1 Tax=Dactylosporangium matsuzakiense TaxID=53360 RepID=A0A9W6KPH2_9ACTN|nr:hypothetical protein [Dactylosporangium matsuzakiense]UWZ40918.1 hypothetical protein Dmats_24615 [Dactylosporangium matsuzakiense]GLL04882.1 hypothetical protein GCM10017581_066290 [Dactylosporangium matsuzakiense]
MRPITALAAVTALAALAGCGGAAGTPEAALPSSGPSGAGPVEQATAGPSAAAPGSVAPAPSFGGADGPMLAGRRKVVIRPAEAGESILAVDGSGRLNLTDGPSAKSLFVLVPQGARHMIRTATADGACLGLKRNGSAPLTIEATACDPGRDGQLFTIKPPSGGDPATYVISVGGAFLQSSKANGLIAEEAGGAGAVTAFVLVDNGPAA